MIKIMVVDDEQDLALMISKRLETLGHLVFRANNGIDAMEKTKTFHPDIIVLDIYMPEMDGYRFLEELRAMEGKIRFTEVIILTARRKMKDAFDPSTIAAFIEKPFDAKKLLGIVKKLADKIEKSRNKLYHALLVGLNWDVMRPLKELIESRGFMTYASTDGHRALEIAVKQSPDIVLCSSDMVGMDIYEFTKLLKDLPTTKKTPLLVYDTIGVMAIETQPAMKGVTIVQYRDPLDLKVTVDKWLEDFLLRT